MPVPGKSTVPAPTSLLMAEPRPPAPRDATIRQTLAEILRTGEYTAHELSRLVGIPEKSVAEHLAHLARSLPARGERLQMTRPVCLGCGYVFAERSRLSRPSRCPQCHSTHLDEPQFQIC